MGCAPKPTDPAKGGAELEWPVFKLQLETFTQKCRLNHLRCDSSSASFLKFLSRIVGVESRGKKIKGQGSLRYLRAGGRAIMLLVEILPVCLE